YDINDAGTVVGISDGRAFSRSSTGEWTDLGILPGMGSSEATAINSKGEIVGFSYGSYDVYQAFIVLPGTGMIRIAPPTPGWDVVARDINDSSEIAGDYEGSAFVMKYPYAMRIIANGARARAINNAGQVVGWVGNYNYSNAFVWDSARGLRYLPVPASAVFSQAHDIDDSGRVIGWVGGASGGAAVWTPNGAGGYTRTYLPAMSPEAINAGGRVAGRALLAGEGHAVLVYAGPPTLPAAPTGVTAGDIALRTIAVGWTDASNNETSFRVFRGIRNADGTFGSYLFMGSVGMNGRAYSDTSAAAGTTYRYQVQACNAAGCAPSEAAVATMPGPPAAPTGLTPDPTVLDRVTLAWTDASSDESFFQVWRSRRDADGTFSSYQTVGTVPADETGFIDWAVARGGTYRYRVAACLSTWNCAPSDPVVVTTAVRPAPDPPANLSATLVSPGRARLDWTQGSPAVSFLVVQRSRLGPDGTFPPYQTIATLGGHWITYSDSVDSWVGTYRYQVQACNDAAWNCAGSAVEVTFPAPAAPGGVTPRAVSATRVDINWTDTSTYPGSIRVRRSARLADGTFPAFETIGTVDAGVTAFADRTVAPGHTYRYVVQACYGGVCTSSGSAVVDVPAVPAAPASLSVTGVSRDRINLAWTDASANESRFLVRRTMRRPDDTYPPYQTIATLPA
ncbi:MAG TPA: hypothetical protein VFQ76_01110, partial [Longimicrobiaceae bacterium]|nr:hypothetical protein [Longimicrobiaceae bacterium]